MKEVDTKNTRWATGAKRCPECGHEAIFGAAEGGDVNGEPKDVVYEWCEFCGYHSQS